MFQPSRDILAPIREDSRRILLTAAEVLQGDRHWHSSGDPLKCRQRPFAELTLCDICEFHLAVVEREIRFDDELAESILLREDTFQTALSAECVPRLCEDRKQVLVEMAVYLAFCLIPALARTDRYLDAVVSTRQFLHRLTWAKHRTVLGAGKFGSQGVADVRFLAIGPPMAALIVHHPNMAVCEV